MTTFTASEVRRAATCPYVLSKNNDMLHAYADRLEADEKAMPVAWRSVSLPTTFICDAPKNLDYEKWEPLYTGPAPTDAERLAEALRLCMDAMLEKGVPTHPDADARVAYTAAEEALAAHSAQAQPPAASVQDVDVLAALKAAGRFAVDVMDAFWSPPDVGSLDGFDLQELAEKHGMLTRFDVPEGGCGEACNCICEGAAPGENCYRWSETFKRVRVVLEE